MLCTLLRQHAIVDVDQTILLVEMARVTAFEFKLSLHPVVLVLSFFGLLVLLVLGTLNGQRVEVMVTHFYAHTIPQDVAIAIEVALHVHGTHSAESAAHWHIATAVVHLRVLLLLRLEVLILVGSDAMRAHATVCDFSLHARTALATFLRRLERLDRFRLDGQVGQLDVVFPCCCS